MERVCQLSYPLNSENASPFGTRTVYLAWPASCAEVALVPKTASTETASKTTTITTAGILLLFIVTPFVGWWLPLSYGKDWNDDATYDKHPVQRLHGRAFSTRPN